MMNTLICHQHIRNHTYPRDPTNLDLTGILLIYLGLYREFMFDALIMLIVTKKRKLTEIDDDSFHEVRHFENTQCVSCHKLLSG